MLYKTVSLGFCAATVSGYGVGMSKLSSSKVSRVGTVEMAKKSVSANSTVDTKAAVADARPRRSAHIRAGSYCAKTRSTVARAPCSHLGLALSN